MRDFRFHGGEVLPELRLHYTTVGARTGEPVLILHGTGGSGTGMLSKDFAGELFGPGQPLDAPATTSSCRTPSAPAIDQTFRWTAGALSPVQLRRHGAAQYRLVTEHLGVRHLRLVLGNSMGGMQTWIWGERYPDFMDALVPMASLPTAMAGRNWMLRRMIVDAVRNDPDWNNGNYTRQPRNLQIDAGVFRHRDFRRVAGAVRRRADARKGRRAAQSTSAAALVRRRQRHPVPVGFVQGLRSRARPRAHPGARCW